MKRLRDRQEQSFSLIDSSQSDTGGLLKTGMLSLFLHMTLIICLASNLGPVVTKTQSIYYVTLRPFSPSGRIPSANPGGSPGSVSTYQPIEPMKPDGSFKESKAEEKLKPERSGRDGIRTDIKKLSENGGQPKAEKASIKSLQEAMEDVRKKVALDEIQQRVARRERAEKRKTDEPSVGIRSAEGQPPVDSSQNQPGSSSKAGSGSGIGTGKGTGSGSGTGGYPIGGVPWGSPQGSSGWSSKLDDYYNVIWAKIKKEWTLPEDLPKGKANIETTIVVVIERNGKIQNSWFEKRSGNALYDQMAMRAIRKAEPLPPIPKEFDDETFEIGIRFHPD